MGQEYYMKAFQYKNEGQQAEAKNYLRKATVVWDRIIAKLPSSAEYTPRAYYSAGVCYYDLGEYEKSINHCRKVVDNWPYCSRAPNAQFFIASCYEKLENSGRIATADAAVQIRHACEKLLANYPDSQMTIEAHKLLKRYEVSEK
jgi:TolA-binding protein